MGTYARPFDTVADNLDELSLRLCAHLEIDPEQTEHIALTVEPGIGAVVRWGGVRRLSLQDVGQIIAGAAKPDPTEKWTVPPDPWADRGDDAGPAGGP